MTVALYLVAILGLAVLMVVHEGGHFFAAKRYGMRVLRFSVGFGPILWKHRPKNSPTQYQIALIPFLAYVQVDGMNPYDPPQEDDKASYANASLWARVVTIAAGPLTNYFFASILIFFGVLIAGRDDDISMRVNVEAGPAQAAGMESGDRIVQINGTPIHSWEELRKSVSTHPGESIDIEVERKGEILHRSVTPGAKGSPDEGFIHVRQPTRPVGVVEAAELSVLMPPRVVYESMVQIGRLLTGKEKLEGVSGPVGIVKETARQARTGPGMLLQFLGMLSAYLGAFNLLPFPALDGGRLLFLGIEAVSRRRPDAKVEARVHAIGLLMLLTLMVCVTYADVMRK